MSAHEERQELEALVRRLQKATKDSAGLPAGLSAALDAGAHAANCGIGVSGALAALKAEAGVTEPAPEVHAVSDETALEEPEPKPRHRRGAT